MLASLVFNNFFAFVIVLFIIVIVHEYGHYLLARLCGTDVETFSVGFGKKLFGFKDKHGTSWQVGPIPLGGFVRIRGQDASFDEEAILKISKDDKGNFVNKNPIQKSLIVISGPAFNFILSALVIFTIFTFYGMPNVQPVISEIVINSPAEKINLQKNDKILEINGFKVNSANDIIEYLNSNKNQNVELKILSNEEVKNLNVELDKDRKLGIKMSNIENIKVPFNEAFAKSIQSTYQITKMSIIGVKQLLFGQSKAQDLGGIIQIAKSSGDAMRNGFESFLFLIALLSINLAILNLLPIPGLDGGHLMFYVLDFLWIGKFIKPKIRAYAVACGFILLIGLMIFANVNDVLKLINK